MLTSVKAAADDDLAFFHEVLGIRPRLYPDAIDVVRTYIPDEELRLLDRYTARVNPLPRFINLTDPAVLSAHLAPCFREATLVAMLVAKRVYEVGPRVIGDTKYGTAFCMNPEVLSYAMQLAKDEVVLEIAGASGENAILLAFAGARRVYMNDITPEEVGKFRKVRDTFPPELRERLESIQGDCFDLPKAKPELVGKVGLIVCRNLIHFFTDAEQTRFFQLVKTLLRPGGRAILTALSMYQKGVGALQYTDVTSFTTITCLVTNWQKNTAPYTSLLRITLMSPEHLTSCNSKIASIYKRERGKKWCGDQAAFNTLPPPTQVQLQMVIKAAKKKIIEPIKEGAVWVVTEHIRSYNTRTLSDTVTRHGFEVALSFVAGAEKGHLVHSGDSSDKGAVGVVIRRT